MISEKRHYWLNLLIENWIFHMYWGCEHHNYSHYSWEKAEISMDDTSETIQLLTNSTYVRGKICSFNFGVNCPFNFNLLLWLYLTELWKISQKAKSSKCASTHRLQCSIFKLVYDSSPHDNSGIARLGITAPCHPFAPKRRQGQRKENHRGEAAVDVVWTMWLAYYSPGCGEEARASRDSPYDAPPDTRPGPWAPKADRADVNVLPAALSLQRISAPQRLQAWLMSFQIRLPQKNNNTLKNTHTLFSFAPFCFYNPSKVWLFRQTSYSYWHLYAFE